MPETGPPPLPISAPASHAVPEKQCTLCGKAAVVHWLRRPTEAELASLIALVQDRRARDLEPADPQLPPTGAVLLPKPEECTTAVFACADHAITLDAATRIHQAICTAPSARDLPGCDCTPEPTPLLAPGATAVDIAAVLPPGWS